MKLFFKKNSENFAKQLKLRNMDFQMAPQIYLYFHTLYQCVTITILYAEVQF